MSHYFWRTTLEAIREGKSAVHISNKCLCALLGVKSIYDQRIRDLASDFKPFLRNHTIHSGPGFSKSATFSVGESVDTANALNVSKLPSFDVMEKYLKLSVRELETQQETIVAIKSSSFRT